MAFILKDRVRETTTTTGTGTITLAGAVTGYQAFSTAIGDGNTTYYTIANSYQWEVGLGTYSASGNTLARTTVLASSTGGTTLVPFAQGSKDVFVAYPAGTAVFTNTSGNVGLGITPYGYKLDIDSTGTTGNIWRGTRGTSTLVAKQDLSSIGYLGMTSSHDLVLISANTEQMRITSSGNVGVGVSNPPAKFSVAGDINVAGAGIFGSTGTGSDAILVQSTNSVDTRLLARGNLSLGGVGTYSNNSFIVTINNVERMRITTGGNVGIGMIPSGTYLLEVNGSIGANSLNVAGAVTVSGFSTFNNDVTFKEVVWTECTETAIVSSSPVTMIPDDIFGRIITTNGTFTYTMCTPAALTAYFNPPTTDISIDFTIINTGGVLTFSMVAGVTLVGSANIPSGSSATFRLRYVSAGAYTLYRIS